MYLTKTSSAPALSKESITCKIVLTAATVVSVLMPHKNVIKPNLLIVGEYNRVDFIDIFKDSINYFNFFFIEYVSRKEVKNFHYEKYGEAIFWGDFSSAQELLDVVKPHKVVFFFLEAYHHVALNIVCKLKGVQTYHLDHGIRDLNINVRLEKHFTSTIPLSFGWMYRFKVISQFRSRLKARVFMLRTISQLPKQEASFLKNFIRFRKKNTYIETYKNFKSPLRTADAYITFARKVYEVHQYYDHLPEEKTVYFIGIPTFDELASVIPSQPPVKSILFIDQALHTRGLLGWDRKNFQLFVQRFSEACTKYGYKILVKPHPLQPADESAIWKSFDNVSIVTDKAIREFLPQIRLVTGFLSTYLLPMMALPHTAVTVFENHPAGKLDVSKSFIDAGVAHPIYNLEELNEILPSIEKLHQHQLPNKAKFTEEWMYKFDGKAGERLRDILLSDQL